MFFLFLLCFGFVAMMAGSQSKTNPHKASGDQVSGDRASGTPNIAIDRNIKDSFPCIYHLLQDLISNHKEFFQEPAFSAFFASDSTRLIFSEKELSPEVGGKSVQAAIYDKGVFRDTLFLNSYYFTQASREYIVAVIAHECVHAFLTWCVLSYSGGLNGVDTLFLQKHCPNHWQWLIDGSLSEQRQHILMSENFLNILSQSVLLYTDTLSTPLLRDSVAESLAWGGLYETPAWKTLKKDTCFLHHVDIWARRIDAPANAKVEFEGCYRTYSPFMKHLNLSPLCQ